MGSQPSVFLLGFQHDPFYQINSGFWFDEWNQVSHKPEWVLLNMQVGFVCANLQLFCVSTALINQYFIVRELMQGGASWNAGCVHVICKELQILVKDDINIITINHQLMLLFDFQCYYCK